MSRRQWKRVFWPMFVLATQTPNWVYNGPDLIGMLGAFALGVAVTSSAYDWLWERREQIEGNP